MGSSTPRAIPSFDLTADPRTTQPNTDQWSAMSRAIISALETSGCALVKYGGISGDDRAELFASMRELFDLPVEAKGRNTARESLTTLPGSIPMVPLYEAQGVMNAVEIDKSEAYTKLMWPQGNAKFCETIHSMSNKMLNILHIILDMIIGGYGISREDNHIGSTDALLHMIKYTAPAKEEPAVGLSEHTDINYLTILCQNEVQGLKIITKEGEWIPVDPGNEYFVVFVGESLKAWSNGRLHPPLHQVVFRGLKDRLTCAVFLKPKPDQVVSTAPEFISNDHPRLYKPFSYGEFHEYSKMVFTDRVNILKNYAGI